MPITSISKAQQVPTSTNQDTIAAISTALGAGAIGIVRLSGPRARSICQCLFVPAKNNGESPVSHALRHGYVIDPDNKSRVDEVLIAQMRAPNTFTKEDMAEINCHGGIIPLQKTLKLCLAQGARLAEPGEFTKRAYLNGRIDLVQAEAVIDIIQAKTQAALQAAINQLEGGLSEKIKQLQQALLNILAQVEADIDFPEEELELDSLKQIASSLTPINRELDQLAAGFSQGRLFREGVATAIVGRPNVGKSTLLNQLLQQERAIVTPIPGTTRDTIEESINLGGFPLRLIDTAGITHSADVVEKHGVKRSRQALKQAELVLLVLDGSQALTDDDRNIIAAATKDNKNIVLIINKIDLEQGADLSQLKETLPINQAIYLSAKQGLGLDKLTKAIIERLSGAGTGNVEGAIITNARHHQALTNAQQAIKRVMGAIGQGLSPEFVAIDLNEALNYLGEIVGQTTCADVLERIFSQFCIGK